MAAVTKSEKARPIKNCTKAELYQILQLPDVLHELGMLPQLSVLDVLYDIIYGRGQSSPLAR